MSGTSPNAGNQRKNPWFIVGAVLTFIGAVLVVFLFFHWLGVSEPYPAFLSLVAGLIVVFVIMGAHGDLDAFSIKTPLFEMTSTLKAEIKNVQTDVNTSKREIEGQITGLSQNMQSTNSKIDSVMNSINTITNTVRSTATANPILYVNFGDSFKTQEDSKKEIVALPKIPITKKDMEAVAKAITDYWVSKAAKQGTEDGGEVDR